MTHRLNDGKPYLCLTTSWIRRAMLSQTLVKTFTAERSLRLRWAWERHSRSTSMVEETTRPKLWSLNASKTSEVVPLPRLSIQMSGGGSTSETCMTETPPKSSADNPPAATNRWSSWRSSVADRTWWSTTWWGWVSLWEISRWTWEVSRWAWETNSEAPSQDSLELWWFPWCWCQMAACYLSPTCSNSWQPKCCPSLHRWTKASSP